MHSEWCFWWISLLYHSPWLRPREMPLSRIWRYAQMPFIWHLPLCTSPRVDIDLEEISKCTNVSLFAPRLFMWLLSLCQVTWWWLATWERYCTTCSSRTQTIDLSIHLFFNFRHWQELGFLIIYVTSRLLFQKNQVMRWLTQHNFPFGMVSFCENISKDYQKHKQSFLRGLMAKV